MLNTPTTPRGKIAAWRVNHPGERLTAATLRTILDLETLRGADLWSANLEGADLVGVSLIGVNLRDADLRDAYLVGRALQITSTPSGQVLLTAQPDGWVLRVGCWTGTVESLRALIAQDTGWPEARGEEVARRRPILAAVADLCDAHIAAWPDATREAAEAAARWDEDAR